MSIEVATPPAAPAAPAAAAPVAPKAPNPSPRLPVPPVRPSDVAIKENISKVWGPDPSKTPPAAEPAKPAEAATPVEKPVIAPAPEVIEKPKAAPEPVAQEHPEDKLPEPASESAKAGWKELKAIAKQERQRAAMLEQQIAELKKAPATAANTDELTALRQELATTKEQAKAASDRLLVLDLQNHPDFHKQFSAPKKAALDTAKEVIAYNGKEAPELNSLLTKPLKDFNAAVSEFTKDMNPADASTVMQSLRQARDIASQEQAALVKAGEVSQSLSAKTQQTQRQAFESVVGEALPNFKKIEVTDSMDADAKTAAVSYNQSIEGLRQKAEAMAFGRVDEKGVANMALKSVALDHMIQHAFPQLQRAVEARDKLINDMAAELKALRGGRAPASVSGQPAEPAPAQGESIEAAAKRVWGR